MGPDYIRPPIDAAEKFRMTQTEGQSIANLPWWELLHDEEVQRLINQALLENRDLKQAVASVEELQARATTARLDFLPKLDVNANAPAFGTLGGFLIRGFPTPYSYFGSANLNWELDIWGRIRRDNEAARGDLMAREENRRAVVLTLAYLAILQFLIHLANPDLPYPAAALLLGCTSAFDRHESRPLV
jgi:multidrug efflux system outer membrane protein